MCLSALWPPVGKVAKAVVAGPAGPELLVPLFWLSMFSPFLLLAYFFFERTSDSTIFTETLQTLRMSQGVITSSHRNNGYGSCREKA